VLGSCIGIHLEFCPQSGGAQGGYSHTKTFLFHGVMMGLTWLAAPVAATSKRFLRVSGGDRKRLHVIGMIAACNGTVIAVYSQQTETAVKRLEPLP
jgi:hypothetical protein